MHNSIFATILHLSLIKDVGPVTVQRLVDFVGLDALSVFYTYSVDDFRQHGFSAYFSQQLYDGLRDKSVVEKELDLVAQHAITLLTPWHESYPSLLRHINAPPTVLYVKGTLANLSVPSLALVGSRQAGLYAHGVIKRLVPGLVESGYAIISGGALGADTMAHAEALSCKGVTAAVIGSGLLQPYPAANKKLFSQIVASGGCIVSPFALNAPPLPVNFPARNRIISGLSLATIVVQAAVKSGARITAQCALEQGRDVGAVPGSIDDPLSAGCHALLSQGAAVITSVNDVLALLGDFRIHETPNVVKTVAKGISHQKDEEPLLALCATPQSFDELLEKTSFSYDDLQKQLLEYQLEGKLEHTIAGQWQKTSDC